MESRPSAADVAPKTRAATQLILLRNVATHLIHFEELVAYDKAGPAADGTRSGGQSAVACAYHCWLYPAISRQQHLKHHETWVDDRFDSFSLVS